MNADFDLVVVGGGINGAGIARDAQGRGLRVLLVEQDDLAQHTSSASTKLIHGGLRYLEHCHFGLVRKALQEREVLLRVAPHIVRPLQLVMPHDPSMRPPWLIRAGLFLYDHLAKRERLPGSARVDLATHPAGAALRTGFRTGFVFSDAWADDARLVVLNALDARERGAIVLTRTRCVGAERGAQHWQVRLERRDGGASAVTARALVNAAGPWAMRLLEHQLQLPAVHALRLVKGSHIVVPRHFEHDHAYVLQNPDGRIVFAIPYEGRFTLIGTTELDYVGDPAQVAIEVQEIRYLCQSVNRYFERTLVPGDVVHAYAGVRPLLEDAAGAAARVTRDYRLELDATRAPLLSVFGGKLTTYRRLAEEALARLLPVLGVDARGRWTASTPLPGGDIPGADFRGFHVALRKRWPWLPEATTQRLARAYGTRTGAVLRNARSPAQLGREILPGFHESELDYLHQTEWALTAEDVLWRRTKFGLHAPASAAMELGRLLAAIPVPPDSAAAR